MGAGVPPNEYGGAFQAELPKLPVSDPENSAGPRGRLLPAARGCAKRVAAPFVIDPLRISGPSRTTPGIVGAFGQTLLTTSSPTISAYERIVNARVSEGSFGGTVTSRITGAKPRISTFSVHVPGSSFAS